MANPTLNLHVNPTAIHPQQGVNVCKVGGNSGRTGWAWPPWIVQGNRTREFLLFRLREKDGDSRGHWCDTVVPNVRTEPRSKGTFQKEVKKFMDQV
eukprot:scaffold1352_cov363-Pavlova_lutheri.AAC.1